LRAEAERAEPAAPEAADEEPAEVGFDEEHDELAAVTSEAEGEELEGAEAAVGENQLDKNSHRAIPSWEEALGFIISHNMEARARHPKAGGPRGRGRGHSRGGHERRGS
jgi:hypothetical protein